MDAASRRVTNLDRLLELEHLAERAARGGPQPRTRNQPFQNACDVSYSPPMTQKRRVMAISVLLTGFVLGLLVNTAMAAYVRSTNGYYGPIRDISYYNYAEMTTDGGPTNRTTATTVFVRGEPDAAPVGWIGVRARSFKDSTGDLCRQGPWTYNEELTAVRGDRIAIGANACGSGYYFARGVTRAWNGTAYANYFTNRTPNIYVADLTSP